MVATTSKELSIQEDLSQTETTVDEPISKYPRTQPKDGAVTYSDTESLDDTIIRNKIAEANQLIERVKKALDKTKFGKTLKCGDVHRDVQGNHSSTTDIEVTIDRLTMETEKLMTGCKEEPETKRSHKRSSRENIEKKSDHSPNSFKKKEIGKEEETTSSCASLNKTFVKKDISSDEFVQEPVPQSRSSFSKELNVRKKSSEQIEDCCRSADKFGMDRPMTRRNELEDDLPEERVLDKFRNCPDEGQIVVNSSLEELQAKLQTISESTESSHSTPRNKKFGDSGIINAPKEVKSSGCNTDNVQHDTQAVQTESEKSNVGIMCFAACEHKTLQVSNHVFLTSCHIDVHTVPSQPKSLVETQLKPHEILPQPHIDVHTVQSQPKSLVDTQLKTHEILPQPHIDVHTVPSQPKSLVDTQLKTNEILTQSHIDVHRVPSQPKSLEETPLQTYEILTQSHIDVPRVPSQPKSLEETPLKTNEILPQSHIDVHRVPSQPKSLEETPLKTYEILTQSHIDVPRVPSRPKSLEETPLKTYEILTQSHIDVPRVPSQPKSLEETPLKTYEILTQSHIDVPRVPSQPKSLEETPLKTYEILTQSHIDVPRVPSQPKSLEETPLKTYEILTQSHIDVPTVPLQPKSLVETQLKTHEILPQPESSKNYEFENLPVVEVAPCQGNDDCKRCKKCLVEEHLPGVTIPSKPNKLKNLSVKILPPISIGKNMTTKSVLNFVITPHGETINYLRETENVTFFLMKSVRTSEKVCPIAVSFCEELEEEEIDEGVVETVDAAKRRKNDPTLNEEMQKKALVYRSYNLFDNRNHHDPGTLDAKSVERISGIDTDVYKTYINPTGMMSEMTMSFRPKPEGIAGFESKAIQCDDLDKLSLMSENKKSADNLPEPSQSNSTELNFVLADSAPSLQKRTSKNLSSVDNNNEDSQVTIVGQQEFESEDLITQSHQSHMPKSTNKYSIEDSVTLEAIASEARLQSTQASQRKSELSLEKKDSSHSKLESIGPRKSESSQKMSETSLRKLESSEHVADESQPLPESGLKSHDGPQPMQRTSNDYFSTPSEITVTISYSSEGSTNSREIKTDVNPLPNQSESVLIELKKDDEPKVITVKDIDIINKLKDKLRTMSVDSSDPKLIIKEDMSQETTDFIKGLIRMSTRGQHFDGEDDTSQSSQEVPTSQNVNYHMIEACLDSNVNLYPEHLIVAKNGRYRDEENLFAQSPYPKPVSVQRKMFPPTPAHKTEDKEIQNDILGAYPKQMLNKYSPESTNSNTVTSNSLSEGEIPCQHAVSNGEIHACKHRYQVNHKSRVIIPRSNLTSFSMNPNHNLPSQRQILARSNLTNSSLNPIHTPNQRNVLNHNITRLSNSPNLNIGPRKFDLLDPKLTIEKRRNYFNHWVTYYVKSQDVLDSSTSSCSHNK